MKVVDMLGCRIPVLAKKFKAIDELVTVNNGRLFNTFEELCALLIEMSSNFPKDPKVNFFLRYISTLEMLFLDIELFENPS